MKVYSLQNGIQNIVPSQVIIPSYDGYNVYNQNGFIKDLLPSYKLKPIENGYNMYKINNGIIEILPVKRVVIDPAFEYKEW